jgi:Glycosyl transferases group 1
MNISESELRSDEISPSKLRKYATTMCVGPNSVVGGLQLTLFNCCKLPGRHADAAAAAMSQGPLPSSSDDEIIPVVSSGCHNREEEEEAASQQQLFRSSGGGGGGGGVVVRRPVAAATASTAAGTTTTTATNSKKKQQSRQRALHHHQHRRPLGMGAGAALVAAAICFFFFFLPDPLIGDRNNRSPLKDPLRRLPLPYEVPASIRTLRDLYDPRHDPILDPPPRGRSSGDSSGTLAAASLWCSSLNGAGAHHRIPARVLLLTKRRPTLYFRKPHDDPTSLMSDELLNIVQVGLARSPCFSLLNFTVVPDLVLDEPHYELSHDLIVDAEPPPPDPAAPLALPPPMVWIVDMRRYYLVRQPYRGFGGNYTILDELLVLVNNTRSRARQRVQQHPLLRLRKLAVVLVDYRDYIPEVDLCRALPAVQQLVQLLGQGGGGHVRYVMQQTVRKRQWNSTLRFVDVGTMYDPRNVSECWGGRSLVHVPYTVRDDVADAVLRIARTQSSSTRPIRPTSSSSANPHLLQPLQDPAFFQSSSSWRQIDVAHMWEYDATCAFSSQGTRVRMPCELRNQVTLALHKHFAPPQYNVRTKIADSLGIRTEVQNEYVQTLVASKIVVVSQRDLWEDSYRLMEALVCGAMVLTDPMLTLPMGLVDRESIVIYQSLEDLPVLIDYYLQNEAERIDIAQRGHQVALSLHRPHHWMERLFFGQVVTP